MIQTMRQTTDANANKGITHVSRHGKPSPSPTTRKQMSRGPLLLGKALTACSRAMFRPVHAMKGFQVPQASQLAPDSRILGVVVQCFGGRLAACWAVFRDRVGDQELVCRARKHQYQSYGAPFGPA